MARYGGIDLGGTKIQAVVVDEQHEVLGSARHPTPTTGGPADVALAMVGALREAIEAAGVGPGELTAVGVGSPGRVDDEAGHGHERAQPPRLGGHLPARGEARGRARRARRALQRRQRRHPGRVRARRRQAVPLAPRRVLGHRRRRRDRARRRAVGGPRRRRRDRPHRRQERRAQVPVRPDRLHGGLRGPRRDGDAGAREGRRGREDGALRDHGGAGQAAALQRHLGARARARRQARAPPRSTSAVDAIGVGVASSLNLLDVEAVVIGGGLGLRLGEPYVEQIREAMMPHLFADHRPPEVLLASLGDLGGAIGATLLAAEKAPAAA